MFVSSQREMLRRIRILDLGRAIDLSSGYVNVNVSPLRGPIINPDDVRQQIEAGVHPDAIERRHLPTRSVISLRVAVAAARVVLLVGDPGAGKSTQLRHLCADLAAGAVQVVPVFVAARDLSAYGGDLSRAIGALLCGGPSSPDACVQVAHMLARGGRMLLCLDGLDELDEADPAEARASLRRLRVQIEELLAAHPDNRVVASVRRESLAACQPDLPPGYEPYEVLPLTPGQAEEMIAKWFDAVDREQGRALAQACRSAGWPGHLSSAILVVLTCIVFERRNRLPDRPSELYRRCLDVLLEEWDATRRLSRHAAVPGFSAERKLDLLAETALDFHMARRCCEHRSEVVRVVARHLPKVGLDAGSASAALAEISSQHGLLRSWSIEGHLAFPHLCFQEYLSAKALRDRRDGVELLAGRVADPFWHETIRLFASQGDAAPLAEAILAGSETLFRQRLFMAAACLCRSAKVGRPEVRSQVVAALAALGDGPVTYLARKAIDALVSLETPEAHSVVRSKYRAPDGGLDADHYACKYAVHIDGKGVLDEVLRTFVTHGRHQDVLLHSLQSVPRAELMPLLARLITTDSYPQEEGYSGRSSGRHRRRQAAMVLAEVGEWDALPLLLEALHDDRLWEFIKEGVVRAIATLPGEATEKVLHGILADESMPVDCRVTAASLLGPSNPEAGVYLRSLVAAPTANHYDRRDAAAALLKFPLLPGDVAPFAVLLMDDRTEVFWGGPAFAAQALQKIADATAATALLAASAHWKASGNPHSEMVLQRINVSPAPTGKLRDRNDLLSRLRQLGDQDWEMRRRVALDYYTQHRSDALHLFADWLVSPAEECGLRSLLTNLVISLLPELEITTTIVQSLTRIALRDSWDERLWACLSDFDARLPSAVSDF